MSSITFCNYLIFNAATKTLFEDPMNLKYDQSIQLALKKNNRFSYDISLDYYVFIHIFNSSLTKSIEVKINEFNIILLQYILTSKNDNYNLTVNILKKNFIGFFLNKPSIDWK